MLELLLYSNLTIIKPLLGIHNMSFSDLFRFKVGSTLDQKWPTLWMDSQKTQDLKVHLEELWPSSITCFCTSQGQVKNQRGIQQFISWLSHLGSFFQECKDAGISCSVSVRFMGSLPYMAHIYIVELLCGMHAIIVLFKKYISFINSAKKFPKMKVQQILLLTKHDFETVSGKNIRYIQTELDRSDIF